MSITIGTSAQDRGGQPARGLAAVGDRVEHRAEAHHGERHRHRDARGVDLRVIGPDEQRQQGSDEQDCRVEHPGLDGRAVGDRDLRIARRPAHDVRVAGVDRDDHDA
jgi:hypothetical protein